MDISKCTPADFSVESVLGRGSYGVVYKARLKSGSEDLAVKCIDLEECDDDGITSIQDEINHLTNCRSHYITQYYGCFLNNWTLCIVMEYMDGGSCLDLIKEAPLSQDQIAPIMKQLVPGLVFLHKSGLVHRDIKAANILLSSKGAVKLADFGVAAQLSNNKSRRHTFVGTPFWMAPEVIEQTERGYDSSADMWSLGITTMELALGAPPLSEYRPMRALFLIPKSNPPELDEDKFSSSIRSFCSACLQKDPAKRTTASALLSHPFINRDFDPSIILSIAKSRASNNDLPPASDLKGISEDPPSIKSNGTASWDFDVSDENLPPQPSGPSKASTPAHSRLPKLDLSQSAQKQLSGDRLHSKAKHVSLVTPTTDDDLFNPSHEPRKHLKPLPVPPPLITSSASASPITPTFPSLPHSPNDLQLAPASADSATLLASLSSFLAGADSMDPLEAEKFHAALLDLVYPTPVPHRSPVGALIRQRWLNKAKAMYKGS